METFAALLAICAGNSPEGVADLQAPDHELQLNFSILPFVGRNGSSKLG